VRLGIVEEGEVARDVVLGIDSGTQSTKVLAVDLDSGEEVAEGRAPHSGKSTQHPQEWWDALQAAIAGMDLSALNVRGLSVAGQQHGCVLIDADGEVVRPAPLWNNVDAAPDAERLNELADFAAEVGTRLVASVTIAKLAYIKRTAPDDIAKAAAVGLPHDWLNFRLNGSLAGDRGDASGSGWWSPAQGRNRRDLLSLAIGEEDAQRLTVPEIRGPDEEAGKLTQQAAAELGLTPGIQVGPGTGDNMAAALGVGAAPGELVISLGTSGTAFAVSDLPTADQTGEVCGFADATGRFLPLACMLNCTRVVDSVAALLGIDRARALDLAADVEPGASGLILLPYFGGERTPNLPDAKGSIAGITSDNLRPELLIRAAVDGVAAGLAYCVEALNRVGVTAPKVVLVGGGAANRAWQQAIADATGLPVTVREGHEHAARGAAIQAAAIVRREPVVDVARRWRPPDIAEVMPRLEMKAAFRMEERRRLINQSTGRM
jgi:xylulokinase